MRMKEIIIMIVEYFNLKSERCLFFYLVLCVSRIYKTRKLSLLPCIYRYTFRFTLSLTTSLLQKLATSYSWNLKQKDDRMDQNILHCCYGDYVTTNQQN